MRRIPIGQACAGDVLAEPLLDAAGRRVLPAGARLSTAVLSRCGRWGITAVAVEGQDEPAADDADVAPVAVVDPARLATLEHRFEGFEDDAAMQRILAVARRHLSSLPMRP